MDELICIIRGLLTGQLFARVETHRDYRPAASWNDQPRAGGENDPRGRDNGEITDAGPVWQGGGR
jgi:hypothetical protein